jgi:hypothetical protein
MKQRHISERERCEHDEQECPFAEHRYEQVLIVHHFTFGFCGGTGLDGIPPL